MPFKNKFLDFNLLKKGDFPGQNMFEKVKNPMQPKEKLSCQISVEISPMLEVGQALYVAQLSQSLAFLEESDANFSSE